MTDNLDFESLFDGLDESQAKQLTKDIYKAIQQTADEFRKPKQAEPEVIPLESEEAQELLHLQQSGVRGQAYAIGKRNIAEKYTQLRAQAPVTVDPEIEKIKDNPQALMQLYKQRIAGLDRNDPRALRKRVAIASDFRKLGLNV